MATWNVTTDTNLSSISGTDGDTVNISANATLTIDATPSWKPGNIQVAQTRGTILLTNSSTTTPIVLTLNANSNDIIADGNGIFRTRGRWIQIGTGDGSASQTLDFDTCVGGVAIDRPSCVLVERERLGDDTSNFTLTNIGTHESTGRDIWRVTRNSGTDWGIADSRTLTGNWKMHCTSHIVMSGWSNSANNDVFNVHDYDTAGTWIEFEAPHYATPVAEASKTSITIKSARVFYNIGGSADTAEVAITEFAPVWESGRVFTYDESSKVATFGDGSTGGVVVPNGAKIYFPNIHVTSASTSATLANRSLLDCNPSGTIDIDMCSFSNFMYLSSYLNPATVRIRNWMLSVPQTSYMAASSAASEVIVNGHFVTLDSSFGARTGGMGGLSYVVSKNIDVRNVGSLSRNDTAGRTPFTNLSTSNANYFNVEVIQFRNTYSSQSVVSGSNYVNIRNFSGVGSQILVDGCAHVYIENYRVAAQPSTVNLGTAMFASTMTQDVVVNGEFSIPGCGKGNGIVVSLNDSSVDAVVHHIDVDQDDTGAARPLTLQGTRQAIAHVNMVNIDSASTITTSAVSYTDRLRYADIVADTAEYITWLGGVSYDGVYCSGFNTYAGNAASSDIRTFFLLYDAADKASGKLQIGLFSPESNKEYFEVTSGTLGSDVYYSNLGNIYMEADGNQFVQTSHLIKGVISFENVAPTVVESGTITKDYAISADGITWSAYQTLNAANLSGETLPDPDDGFYMRLRCTVSGASTTRYITYLTMEVETDPDYLPVIDWREVQFHGMVAGSVAGVFKSGVLLGQAVADASGDATVDVECLFDNKPVEYDYKIRKAGYGEVVGAVEVNHIDVPVTIAQILDRTVGAAVAGVAVDGDAKTITTTAAMDILELYDTVQAWSEENIEHDVPIVRTTDTLFEMATDWELIVEAAFDLTGYTLAGNFDLTDTGVTGGALDGYIKIDLTMGGTCTAIVAGTVDYTEAGTYDCRSHVFVGTVELVNSSGGNVTVKVPIGTSYTNTGPDITVEESAAITVANANIEDDSRVQIYNVTQDTELDNSAVSGGAGYSLAATVGAGQEIEVGETIRIRATFADGADYRENYEEFAVATTSNITFIGTQSTWTHANSLSVDGSAQTEFSTDFVNVEVDTDASGNLFDVADMIGWLLYTQTTEDGIRNWYGALTSTDAANWKIATAQVDLYIDNVNAATATQGDTVILMRDDLVYPQVVPTSGGGGIGMIQSGLVFVTETGVSGLTASESSQLMNLPSAADTADAVWDETIAGKTTAATMLDSVYSVDVANEIDSAFQSPGKIDGVASRDEALHLAAAGTGAKTSGMDGTSPKIRSLSDDRDLVDGTVDANGNRTAITLDL